MTVDLWLPADTPDRWRARLAAIAHVHIYPPTDGWPQPPNEADMLVSAMDVRGALAAIDHLSGLQVVQTLSAGVDRVVGRLPDGVTLCDASGVHDIGVAEWAVMSMLAMLRRLPQLLDGQRAATWRRDRPRGNELSGSQVLILGYGSIGRALEERLKPFGTEIVRVARRARDGVHELGDLPALLPTADIVVVLLPLTPQTRGLVDADVLSRMKRGALLVNAARGPIVDTEALVAALRDGRIRAALDVTDPEPLPDGHPLWSLPDVLITPHVAGDVSGEEDRAWAFVADQVRRLERGEPLRNVVAAGY